MKEKKILKLDKTGLQDYKNEILKVEQELKDHQMYKGKDAIHQGDNWHDNPTFTQAEKKEKDLMMEISELKQQLYNAEIIERVEGSNLIEIGDTVFVNMSCEDNKDYEEENIPYKLVATRGDLGADILEISVNSPLGKSIYRKEVGDTVPYKVDGTTISVEILSKQNLDNDISMDQVETKAQNNSEKSRGKK